MKQWMKMLQNEAFLCMTHKCPDLFIPTSPPLKSFKMAGSWFDQPPQPWRLGAASASQFKWLGLTWKVIFTHPETSQDQGTIQTLTILQFTVYTMFTQLMPDPFLAVHYIFNLNVSAELKFKLWSLDTGLRLDLFKDFPKWMLKVLVRYSHTERGATCREMLSHLKIYKFYCIAAEHSARRGSGVLWPRAG